MTRALKTKWQMNTVVGQFFWNKCYTIALPFRQHIQDYIPAKGMYANGSNDTKCQSSLILKIKKGIHVESVDLLQKMVDMVTNPSHYRKLHYVSYLGKRTSIADKMYTTLQANT